MKMRSYGGDFINPSNEELTHGQAGHKKVAHFKGSLSYPTYPDSVEGVAGEQRETFSSVKGRLNKKGGRVN
jgi:hypothetical protein